MMMKKLLLLLLLILMLSAQAGNDEIEIRLTTEHEVYYNLSAEQVQSFKPLGNESYRIQYLNRTSGEIISEQDFYPRQIVPSRESYVVGDLITVYVRMHPGDEFIMHQGPVMLTYRDFTQKDLIIPAAAGGLVRFAIAENNTVVLARVVNVTENPEKPGLKVVLSSGTTSGASVEESRTPGFMSLILSRKNYVVKVPSNVKFEIAIRGASGQTLGAEELLPEKIKIKKRDTVAAFAIDPTAISFEYANFTRIAQGEQLHKCRLWDYSTQSCMGNWEFVQDLVPGQEYTINITPDDPGYGETIPTPTAGWNETLGSEQIRYRICHDLACTNVSTNFQPNDIVYVVINTSPADVATSDTNNFWVYLGSSSDSLIARDFLCTGGTADSLGCYTNFTIPADWAGWYYLDARTRGGTGNFRHFFKHPITVGPEPVSGYSLKFFRDVNYTIEGDTFTSGEMVYVEFNTGSPAVADPTNTEPSLMDFHRTRIGTNPEVESYSSVIDPYRFNFTMPTLTQGNWYYFEPRLQDSATNNIPGATVVHGRFIWYKSNSQPTITTAYSDSPYASRKSAFQNITFNASFTDLDDIDRHKMLVCNSSTVRGTSCSNTTLCSQANYTLYNPLNCSYTAQPNNLENTTSYAFVCDWRASCSPAKAVNWSMFKDSTAPIVRLNQPQTTTTFTDPEVTFNYTPSDNYQLANCSLYTNATGSWAIDQSNSTLSNNTPNFFVKSFASNGWYKWNVQCADTYYNSAYNSTNRTLRINSPPIVQLMSPNANSWTSTSSVVMSFNVSSSVTLANCTLLINNTINQSNTTSIPASTRSNFTLVLGNDTTISWGVNCSGTDGSMGDSPQRLLYVDLNAPVISFIYPTPNNGDYVNSTPVVINISVTDNNPGILALNVGGTLSYYSYSSPFFNISLDLDDGQYTINATANDTVNHNSTTEQRSFQLDTSTVRTYNDSGLINYSRTFLTGSTVYVLMTDATASQYHNFEFWPAGSATYTYRSNTTLSTPTRNVTSSQNMSINDALGTWYIRVLSNPRYSDYYILDMVAPTSGLVPTSNFDITFRLYSRNGSLITTDMGGRVYVLLQRVDSVTPTNIWDQYATSANGWTFTSGTGQYTKNYNSADNRLYKLMVSANNATNSETNDSYGIAATSTEVMGTGNQQTTSEPCWLNITNPAYTTTNHQITVRFKIYAMDYSTPITSFDTAPDWLVNATEANDYDQSSSKTTVSGSTPVYNSASGLWETTLTLPAQGKYDVSVGASSNTNTNYYVRDGFIVNYPMIGTFTLTQSGTSLVLNKPVDGAVRANRTVYYNFTPTDVFGFKNCSVFTNTSGWQRAANNNTAVNNTNPNLINITYASDGVYLWNAECTNLNLTVLRSPANFTIYIDTTQPNITLLSPPNNTYWTTSNVVGFSFNVTDLTNVSNCSLLINNNPVDTDTVISKGINYTIYYALSNLNYNWSINCSDVAGNSQVSLLMNITASYSPPVWNGTWFETSTSSCASSSCNISLANARDATANSNSYAIDVVSLGNIDLAVSPYLGRQYMIPAGTAINFSGNFTAQYDGYGYVSWFLYIVNSSGDYIIASDGDNSTGGARIGAIGGPGNTGYRINGSYVMPQQKYLQSTDKLKLSVQLYNSYVAQATATYTHLWDLGHPSFVNITQFYSIGQPNVTIIAPPAGLTILENQTFNITCNVTCPGGFCYNVSVYPQFNSSTTAFANIGAGGNITLNGSESAPHNLGNFSYLNASPFNTTFIIKGPVASVSNVRCAALSTYNSAMNSNATNVTVLDITPPRITLSTPANNSWNNTGNLTFSYTPGDSIAIPNCTIIINNVANATNNSITKNATNSFAIRNIVQGPLNWSVNCTDLRNNTGSSPVYRLTIDRTRPGIELVSPANGSPMMSGSANFTFNTTDNMAANMTCSLTIDGQVNRSGINATSGVMAGYFVSGFTLGLHYWNVTCSDTAWNLNTSATWWINTSDTPASVYLTYPADNHWNSTGSLLLLYNASDNAGFRNCSLIINSVVNQTNQSAVLNNQLNNFSVSGMAEGYYNWSVNCTDTGGNIANSSKWRVNIDRTSPLTLLVNPQDGAQVNHSLNLIINVTDNMDAQMNCNITFNGTTPANLSNFTASNGSAVSKAVSGLADALYQWNATCWDEVPNYNTSTTKTFNVSNVPVITLTNPGNNDYENSNITFQYTPWDNDGLTNCSILITYTINTTNTTGQLLNGVMNNITVNGFPQGDFSWGVNCTDNGTYRLRGAVYDGTFHVDTTGPGIQLNLPLPGANLTASTVRFNWTAIDNLANSMLCNLTVNGLVNQTNVPVTSNLSKGIDVGGFVNNVYYWNVTCADNAGNFNTSASRNFSVTIAPTVTITAPAPNAWVNTTNTTITFTPSSYTGGGFRNCSLVVNGTLNISNATAVAEDASNNIYLVASDQSYNISVNCTDSMGVTGSSAGQAIWVDTVPPYVQLNSPANNNVTLNGTVTFNYTATDNLDPTLNCSLAVNSSYRLSNYSSASGSPITPSFNLSDGYKIWNVTCRDHATNANTSSTWGLTINQSPVVALQLPANNAFTNSSNLTFIYYAFDNDNITNCSLNLSGAINSTNTTIQNNMLNNFTLYGMSDGLYTWTIRCFDSGAYLNRYSPQARNLTIDSMPPSITLTSPTEGYTSNVTAVLFNYTPTDTMSSQIGCNLTLNSVVRNTSSVQNASPNPVYLSVLDAFYQWNVTCIDSANNTNTSPTRTLNQSVIPFVTAIGPDNLSWSGAQSVNFTFNASDNDGFANCTLITMGLMNKSTTSVQNGLLSNITAPLLEGRTNWSIICYDNGTYRLQNSSIERIVYIDRTVPYIQINSPANNTPAQNSSVIFNVTVSDNLAFNFTCNLTIDGRVNQSFNASNASFAALTVSNFPAATHIWNVTCRDQANNSNTSLTYQFSVPQADLYINSTLLSLNDTAPKEGSHVLITATVWNIGGVAANNFTVRFYDGLPPTGTQLGANRTANLSFNSYISLNATWNATIGIHTLFVTVDPANQVAESNESNNNVSLQLLISGWQIVYGNITGALQLSDNLTNAVFIWNESDINRSNVYATDYDSTPNWAYLRAIGRNASNDTHYSDFAAIDTALATTNNSDSVNRTYTLDGSPLQLADWTVFNKIITSIPVVNSTNTSAFKTGILWDSILSGQFTASEDLVFITQVNKSQQGMYGTYDFELRIPAGLRSYKGPDLNTVTLYFEIT